MNVAIHLKNIRGNSLLKNMIERKTEKIEKMLRNYKTDMTDLSAILEKNTRKKLYNSKIVLKLPTGTIISEKQGFSSFEAIGKSFKSIFIEIKEHILKLKHKNEYSKEISLPIDEKTEKLSKKTNIEFRDELLANLAVNIQYFIQYTREEIFILQKEYQRKINFVLPEEIVDHAIITLFDYNEIKSFFSFQEFEKEMYKTLKVMVKEMVEDKITNQSDISVETHYKEPMISEDEIYDYYQPDLSWNLSDVLYLSEDDIDSENSEENQVKKINEFIEILYPENRQLFYLYYIKKYRLEEIETILRKSKPEIEKAITEVSELLKVNDLPL